jgi:3-deoxy-D-arabino-heptulosonate 7-phosphate (DAHP) synthase class II
MASSRQPCAVPALSRLQERFFEMTARIPVPDDSQHSKNRRKAIEKLFQPTLSHYRSSIVNTSRLQQRVRLLGSRLPQKRLRAVRLSADTVYCSLV